MSSGGLFKSAGEAEEDDGALAAVERLLPIVGEPGLGVLARKTNESIVLEHMVFESRQAAADVNDDRKQALPPVGSVACLAPKKQDF